ncbi:thiol reductant ABC exporter subunit CydD [Pseudogracilibacillus sp. ICA-222130]|uniref:thiol reductant ABC exporter subunit CydD n=1 Tax=Pseudogracilibacillus sp. ICA-222130 TaxID=3134655 RepID=UPI0030C1D385
MKNKRQKGLPMYPGALSTYSLLTCFIFIEVGLIIAQSIYLARAITLLFQKTPIEDVFIDIGFFFIAFILRYIVTHIEGIIAQKHSDHVSTYLREKLLYQYFHQPSTDVQKIGTGHLVQLLMEGIAHVKTYVEIIGIRMIKTIIVPAIIVLYVFFVDRSSAYILIFTVPIIIIFMILLGLAAEKMADKQYVTYTRLANHFVDSLKGLETLAFLGKSKVHGRRIEKVSNDYRKTTMKTLRIAFLSSFALDFFTSLSIAFVAVGLGLRLIDGTIWLLPSLTILLLAPEYFSPIKQVGKDFHATLDGQVAMAEMNDWLASERIVTASTKRVEERVENVVLNNIGVTMEERPILQGIHVSVDRGFVAVLGESGAGKTTLLQLLAGRIDPTEGNFRVNKDVWDTLHDASWFDHIAYIPQHPYIFPISLADNIRFYEPSASDERVLEMIQQIGLQSLVDSFPNGIHERIGEGGRTISGGQEQRVALARALLSDKQIILLDEPTAHLDIETEYEIKQLILEHFYDKFVFITTHRLHWVKNSTQIIWMDEGKVGACGEHNALLQQNEAYRLFFDEQRGEDSA